ncbi:MAG: aldo/keto reductase [Treponema sp.]|jgi:predicted aldo/keto reductase-like oxidoreductase|nr:aldo/keto reductase [Treponema sp.]
MQFRVDKKSGNRLSALGFGCMRFPRNLGSIDMRKTEFLVMEAIGGGVNYFDTAYIYPGSEDALGTILEKNRVRDKVYIAGKLPLVLCKGPADFDRFFNKELERLKTGYIDYYLMHMITDTQQWDQFRAWGIEAWLAEKKRAGAIRQAGFSYHGSRDEFLAVLDRYPWDFTQIQYNYSDENFQAGVAGLKKAASLGLPVIIMEPLLGGKLATGLPPGAVEIFKKADPSLSPAGWALRWLWNQEEATVILSGMNSPEQLMENVTLTDEALPGCLSAEQQQVYRDVMAVVNSSYRVRCTGCNYCMPCPRGVNIPGCFAAYNTSFSMGFVQGMQQYITSTAPTSERTSGVRLCVKCGKCESHCPQRLPIIKNLQMVGKRMEPFYIRAGIAAARRFLGRGRK